jgi:O-antigen/teichoic acid export membrane protein
VGRRQALASYSRGPLLVASGSVVLGLCSYVFLSLAARTVGPVDFGELSTLWAIVFGFVAGLWLPFEQELTRIVASAGEPSPSVSDLRRVAILQGSTLVLAEVVVVIVVTVTSGALFGGSAVLGLALAASMVSVSVAGFQRGMLLGSRRFGWAAVQQGSDGAVRAIGAVVCANTGASVGVFALVLALAPLGGVLAALPGTPVLDHVRAVTRTWGDLVRDLAALLAGSYLAIVVLNIGPLVVRVGAGPAETGRFMAVFVVARLPLFFAGPVVAGLLPSFVDAYAGGTGRSFVRTVRAVVAVVALGAVVGCLALGLLGPWLARVFFGSAYAGDLTVSVLLAVSSALFVVAMVMQGALVAAQDQRAVARAWLTTTAAFGLGLLLPLDIDQRVAVAYVISGVVAVAAMSLLLSRTSTTPSPVDAA